MSEYKIVFKNASDEMIHMFLEADSIDSATSRAAKQLANPEQWLIQIEDSYRINGWL